jgi:predicted nucleic-acid-binding Zn-ribbon protein
MALQPVRMVKSNEFEVDDSLACPQCGNPVWRTGTVYTVGSFLARMLNIKTRKFATTTCTQCGYTEFYERRANTLGNILDILIR